METSDERVVNLNAVKDLKSHIEEDFVDLGQLLSEMKKTSLHKHKGYMSFKEFVETDFGIAGSFAAKLIANYDVFAIEKEIDDARMKRIGLDKLNIIKSLVKGVAGKESDQWISTAEELSATELRAEVKAVRDVEKENAKSMKEIFTDQHYDEMLKLFNCNRKGLEYPMALYFDGLNRDEVLARTKAKREIYEDQLTNTAFGALDD